jgi:hypothetical protein
VPAGLPPQGNVDHHGSLPRGPELPAIGMLAALSADGSVIVAERAHPERPLPPGWAR